MDKIVDQLMHEVGRVYKEQGDRKLFCESVFWNLVRNFYFEMLRTIKILKVTDFLNIAYDSCCDVLKLPLIYVAPFIGLWDAEHILCMHDSDNYYWTYVPFIKKSVSF